MEFELDDFHRDISDADLLDDLRDAQRILSRQGASMSFRSYNEVGKYSASTIAARFGSWNDALSEAGLELVEEKNVSVEALFENLKDVWLYKGKQPVFRDMATSPSKYRGSLYIGRFGSWRGALQKFVEFVKSDAWVGGGVGDKKPSKNKAAKRPRKKRRTSRDISERMRFRILLRDGFECQSCGASPLKDRGVELHVDHILPWSKGGETEDANLQTKCKRCNLGKGDAFSE